MDTYKANIPNLKLCTKCTYGGWLNRTETNREDGTQGGSSFLPKRAQVQTHVEGLRTVKRNVISVNGIHSEMVKIDKNRIL